MLINLCLLALLVLRDVPLKIQRSPLNIIKSPPVTQRPREVSLLSLVVFSVDLVEPPTREEVAVQLVLPSHTTFLRLLVVL